MIYDIFKDDKEKAEARQALADIQEHPGWKYIKRAVAANVAYFSEQLREKKDFANLQEVYALQDRISDLESFEELPANLLIDAQAEEDQPEEDIYQVDK